MRCRKIKRGSCLVKIKNMHSCLPHFEIVFNKISLFMYAGISLI